MTFPSTKLRHTDHSSFANMYIEHAKVNAARASQQQAAMTVFVSCATSASLAERPSLGVQLGSPRQRTAARKATPFQTVGESSTNPYLSLEFVQRSPVAKPRRVFGLWKHPSRPGNEHI